MATADDIKRWVHDHVERSANPPLAETVSEIHERTKDNTPLQNRVMNFLHYLDNFAVRITDGLDSHTDRLMVYHLVKAWCSTLVGWDAPKSEYVDKGFDVLMDYAIERLKV
jgi:hypothetical protein